MKDFYWDIRPKPEYGTIEIRVFDTPLTVERAAALAGFVQSLAAWFLHEQPFVPHEDDYMVYTYNRFQACRFGLEAVYVDPVTGEHMPLRDHMLLTLRQLAGMRGTLGAGPAIQLLAEDAELGTNDARWLRSGRRASGCWPRWCGRRRALPAGTSSRRSTRPPRPQGTGGEPERPGGLRRAAAGLHARRWRCRGRRSLARAGFSRGPVRAGRGARLRAGRRRHHARPAGDQHHRVRRSAGRRRRCCARARGPATTSG
jgi:hypothetical protein